MLYKFSYTHPHRHYVDIEMVVSNHQEAELILQLPSWRPGRYELGDFAKNIQSFKVFDEAGNPLKFQKITKDCWKVSTPNIQQVHIKYNYYANELNAGSTYLDEKQLYVNPVNCCLFVPSRMEEDHRVALCVPDDYIIACSLKKNNNNLIAKSFDELAESPWVASATLQHKSYTVKDYKFYVWFQGDCKPDWDRIISDFRAFTVEQIKDFGHFPVKEYHFINQILPYKTYHGVEHTASTVISLGPGEDLMGEDLYQSLLGVSSHELYHTWNIKQIRPVDLLPYDYSKENYSRMGYLYEGVTTYMGDLYLRRSKVFDDKTFFKTQEGNLLKHFHNGGRTNMSVADSSFDTWLDGYVLGVPNRKVSIYTEGALCAFMLDVQILKKSNGSKSLRDLMTKLYTNYAQKGKGVSEEDYIHELISFGGEEVLKIIEDHLYDSKDFRPSLDLAYELVGLQITEQSNSNILEREVGVKGLFDGDSFHIKRVAIDSIADKVKIAEGDVILEINGKKLSKKYLESLKNEKQLELKVKKRFEVLDVSLDFGQNYYPIFKIHKVNNSSLSVFCFGD